MPVVAVSHWPRGVSGRRPVEVVSSWSEAWFGEACNCRCGLFFPSVVRDVGESISVRSYDDAFMYRSQRSIHKVKIENGKVGVNRITTTHQSFDVIIRESKMEAPAIRVALTGRM